MKKTGALLSFVILIVLLSHAHAADLGVLRTSLIEGDVQIRTAYTQEWFPAVINMPLMDGDQFRVAHSGRLEIQLRDGSLLRLDGNSSLSLTFRDADSPQFDLTEGRAYINFKGAQGSVFRIDTLVSSIYSYDPAVFRLDISRDRYVRAAVLRGDIYAENTLGRTRISAGNMITLDDNNYTQISRLEPPDSWERWNRDRDREFEDKTYSHRYLPEELRRYSYDFDEYGDWKYTAEYGYVWRPTVIISSGWSPYRLGRWIWRGSDYVWVSYEPWGWAPYHYGRWSHTAAIGWFWVPPLRGEVYWGPGFVGWVHTPTYVAWVPLAPREIYYGRGYYGPHSVNIVNVTVHKTAVRPVYRNVHIHNSVTVVHNDTFAKGKRVNFRIKENPFLERKAQFGRPEIKREKELFMPIAGDADRKIFHETKLRQQHSRNTRKNSAARYYPQSLIRDQRIHVTRDYPVNPVISSSDRTINQPGKEKGYYRGNQRAMQRDLSKNSTYSTGPVSAVQAEGARSRGVEAPRGGRQLPLGYANPDKPDSSKKGRTIRKTYKEDGHFSSSAASSPSGFSENRVQRTEKENPEYRNSKVRSHTSNEEVKKANPVPYRTPSPEVRRRADNSTPNRLITENRQRGIDLKKRDARESESSYIRDSRSSKGYLYDSGNRGTKGPLSGHFRKMK